MKEKKIPPFLIAQKLVLLVVALWGSLVVNAQAPPTSLSYPTPNIYIANISNVFLSPNVAGNVTSYSISPAASTLPAGLSFNTSTGVISGIPTTEFAATNYTVTASGGSPSGTSSAVFSLQVTNNFFNNNYTSVSFSTSTPIRGNGKAQGDTILYSNVATLSGKPIDVLVITRSRVNVDSFNTYDQAALTGNGYTDNSPNFFSPQVTFGTGGGSVTFNFQFILGGSFNTTTRTAQSVTLQNVKINTYDIDGNNNANSNQYTSFGGFDTSEVGSPTVIAATYDAVNGLTKFRSNISTNSSAVTADSTRIRVTSNNISNFTIVLGAESNGLSYFFLDFSSGYAFATAVKTPAPSLDLNTSLPGVNNVGSGCGSLIPFTGAGQTNLRTVPATLNDLTIAYDNSIANIRNGAGERIVISGGTPASADTILLNFAAGTSPAITLGGVTFAVTREVSGNTSMLTFTNNAGGTFTLAQAETLLDALQYGNTSATPVMGARNFTVSVRNSSFKSPDAIFTPTITCVSISGNILIDNNGLTDNTVNANSTIGQLAANAAYAVLVNPGNNQVIAVQGIAAGGAYTFSKLMPGTYNVIVRNTSPAISSVITTASYPSGTSGVYRSQGENLGATAGNDQLVDGILKLTAGSANITDANFGIELAPVTANTSYTSVPNPGGFNNYPIPSGGFNATDEDGTVSSITITAYPTGANYLKIGTVYYTSTGSTCPPQATCTSWTGPVTVPFASGNPSQTIAVDPIATGAVSISIPYYATDNAGVTSNASTVDVSFSTVTPYTISGNVWNDSDANGVRNGAEALTNAASSGQTLYAYLVQTNVAKTYSGQATIYACMPVSATTGYSFTDVAGANDYEVHIVSAATAPVPGALASSVAPALATNYVGVSTSKNGVATPNLNTADPFISFANVSANQPNNNLGIERRPTGAGFTAARQANPGTATRVVVPVSAFTATDVEDAPAGYANNLNGRNVVLNTPANGTIYYAGTVYIPGTTITGFNPANVSILPSAAGALTPTFTYAVLDNAGIASTPVTVSLPLDVAVPISGSVWDDNDGNAARNAGTEPLTNAGGLLYAVLTDVAGNVVQSVAVSGSGAYSFPNAAGSQTYNVVLSTTNAAAGTKLTAATLPVNWVHTGVNLDNTANTGNTTGVISVTTPASGSRTLQDFGIEQRATADGKSYTVSGSNSAAVTAVNIPSTASGGGNYSYRIAMSGLASTGNTPGILTGTDADGNSGAALTLGSTAGAAIKVSINPSSYTALNGSGVAVPNGVMLLYNGVQLQPGGCQGANVGAGLCSAYNTTTGAWEIANYDASLLTILLKNGVKSETFQYSWIDAAGKAGTVATYGISATIALPVELLSFTATPKAKHVVLDWKVASEMRLSGYVIERSADANDFTAIQKVAAHNAGREDSYQQVDAHPLSGMNYYRLRIEESDGSHTYSSTQSVRVDGDVANTVSIYPNPVTTAGTVTVHLSTIPESGSVRIMDQVGRLLVQQSLEKAQDTRLDLSKLPAGMYLVTVIADGQMEVTKLVIQ